MTTHFRVTYDGPALAASTMDVRDLAPALLAVGDALDAATRALYGDRIKAQVNVRASFKTGSFGIDLALATDWALKVRDLLVSDNASAAANAIEILGFLGLVAVGGAKGLIAVIQWLRGRRIERVELRDERCVLYVEDEHLEVERSVIALLRDLAVRRALDKMLAPLDQDGIDTFACGTDTTLVATVHRDERAWFRAPDPEEELLLDDQRKMAFSIISLAFREDNKWRLYDGAATIHATLSDTAFLARVDANQETFAKGDVLICMVRVRQWQTIHGARTEYEVTEVLEHRQAAVQLRLTP